MLSCQRFLLLLGVALIVCTGCQSKTEKLRDDLKRFGLAYTDYEDTKKTPPKSWEELLEFAKATPEMAESVQRVRDAGYEVSWGLEVGSQGAGDTVLAKPASGDGPVVMLDGRVPEL